MAEYQVVTREMIRQRARFAFLHGQDRNSHNMNPSNELDTWLAEYDRLAAEFPCIENTPSHKARIDAAQVSPC